MSDNRLWYCNACDFYHVLGEVCPKTGEPYEEETMKLESKVGFIREETKILKLPKVKKK